MIDHKKWFEKYGRKTVCEDCGALHADAASAEEMFQAFKARLISEVYITQDNKFGIGKLSAAPWNAIQQPFDAAPQPQEGE